MIDNAAWRIQHALAYPFDPPDRSYLYAGGRMTDLADADFTDRVPVLASGSNGSPARLRQKFGTENTVPVTRVRLHGLVAAHAARVTSYGSIPATLAPLPPGQDGGCITHCTWLTPHQLDMMHQTESVGTGYGYCAVATEYCTALDGPMPDAPGAYISLSGYLPDHLGQVMALPHHDQADAQARVRTIVAPDQGQDQFIAANVLNADHRARMNALLRPIGITIKHAGLTRLL